MKEGTKEIFQCKWDFKPQLQFALTTGGMWFWFWLPFIEEVSFLLNSFSYVLPRNMTGWVTANLKLMKICFVSDTDISVSTVPCDRIDCWDSLGASLIAVQVDGFQANGTRITGRISTCDSPFPYLVISVSHVIS